MYFRTTSGAISIMNRQPEVGESAATLHEIALFLQTLFHIYIPEREGWFDPLAFALYLREVLNDMAQHFRETGLLKDPSDAHLWQRRSPHTHNIHTKQTYNATYRDTLGMIRELLPVAFGSVPHKSLTSRNTEVFVSSLQTFLRRKLTESTAQPPSRPPSASRLPPVSTWASPFAPFRQPLLLEPQTGEYGVLLSTPPTGPLVDRLRNPSILTPRAERRHVPPEQQASTIQPPRRGLEQDRDNHTFSTQPRSIMTPSAFRPRIIQNSQDDIPWSRFLTPSLDAPQRAVPSPIYVGSLPLENFDGEVSGVEPASAVPDEGRDVVHTTDIGGRSKRPSEVEWSPPVVEGRKKKKILSRDTKDNFLRQLIPWCESKGIRLRRLGTDRSTRSIVTAVMGFHRAFESVASRQDHASQLTCLTIMKLLRERRGDPQPVEGRNPIHPAEVGPPTTTTVNIQHTAPRSNQTQVGQWRALKDNDLRVLGAWLAKYGVRMRKVRDNFSTASVAETLVELGRVFDEVAAMPEHSEVCRAIIALWRQMQ